MLRSRGAGIFRLPLPMSWNRFLGVIALVLGPYLGLWMARAIGAASIPSTVDRQSLPVILSDAYLYGFVGLVTLLGLVIPVIKPRDYCT